MDFVTDLPPSSGNTVILTMVDHFSKAVHFIPLSKLPSVRETAQMVIDHVFWIHSLPEDVVFDRGPIFGGNSVGSWVPPPVCPQDSIHRPNAKPSVLIWIWSGCSDVWPPITPPPGISN